jgi:hypothetical protein
MMIGRFTETKELKEIRAHLMHGRIVYVFTGTKFLLMHYEFNHEKGIIRNYSIIKDKEIQSKECNLFGLMKIIKDTLENEEFHYLLYYGDLNINASIYDFMKEFYSPSEELPLVVVTAMVEAETIRTDISYPGNIEGNVLTYVDEFIQVIMEKYLNEELFEKEPGCYSIFSLWLMKEKDAFEFDVRSNYLDFVRYDEGLMDYIRLILTELTLEMRRLGIVTAV